VPSSLAAQAAPSRTPVAVAAFQKRLIDVVVGSVLSLLALPLLVLMAVGVAVSLRTTPLFLQWRYGTSGRPFRVIKVRTLPKLTPSYMDKHQLRIDEMPLPALCRFLRQAHLDELPQLFQVVTGKMSLVGPRPRMCGDAEPVEPHYDNLRTSVKPGCTGLWQVSVEAGKTATAAPRFDLFYLRFASLRLDAWIAARTIMMILGLAHGVETTDVPRWALGSGLLQPAAFEEATVAPRQRAHVAIRGPRQPVPAGRFAVLSESQAEAVD
jgi:lipopolysaccharide/colanic/teichoic acid biosynthesis glycosyltransferase